MFPLQSFIQNIAMLGRMALHVHTRVGTEIDMEVETLMVSKELMVWSVAFLMMVSIISEFFIFSVIFPLSEPFAVGRDAYWFAWHTTYFYIALALVVGFWIGRFTE